MATVTLGIITLRLSLILNQKEQIAKIQELRIKKIYLYNMFSDYVPSQLQHSNVKDMQFLLKVVLSKAASGYELSVSDIGWADCDENYESRIEKNLPDCKVYVDEAGDPVIYVYFNDFNCEDGSGDYREKISYFYHINRYEPLLMERYSRCRWLRVTMTMKERIWKKGQKQECFSVELRSLLENGRKREDCVELYEVKHNMQIGDAIKLWQQIRRYIHV